MSVKTSDSKVRSASNRRRLARNRVVAALVLAVVAFFAWQAVAPHVANSATGEANVVSYTVRPGDTLWSYARQITPESKNVGDTVAQIMDLNQLDSAQLQPGQRIVVPDES
ncbi:MULTISPECIES: LysM peptidoglycan-binding domain-containing protein [unclassified Bifidobacterium]|uniref:LysM peptidoglycan-binding domain-containing protein n=1 Tax=unclassified Bifidobacterium TaxID=2608897 RepID=UPI0023F7A7C4|nr:MULTISPECIES: LysM peptidoglycan-binding domain-containing protein [unclassified Bifidobacterium]WEV66244.1 LysM peptidoglycan-binding domain-containing protein [Bifidobacterium sp. ESL0764]WEV74970.1 LysM peptidoglycan-binding domain-containing protein [Bifidobacterium sp. ESL0800]